MSSSDDWSLSLTQWLDQHQRLIRTSTWLLPGIGLALLAYNRGAFYRHRSWTSAAAARPFTAFSADISFNKNSIQLYLYHTSAIRRALALSPTKVSSEDTLPAILALVQLENSFEARSQARDLLWRRNLLTRVLNDGNNSFSSPPYVFAYRGIGGFRWDVGKELIRRGAATVSSSTCAEIGLKRTLDEYRRTEDWAKIRGAGMWRQQSKVERLNAFGRMLRRFWDRQRGN